jgi:hypothetical protein
LGWGSIKATKDAFDAARFRPLPEIERALSLGFTNDFFAFREQLQVVYKRHVIAYFAELAAG